MDSTEPEVAAQQLRDYRLSCLRWAPTGSDTNRRHHCGNDIECRPERAPVGSQGFEITWRSRSSPQTIAKEIDLRPREWHDDDASIVVSENRRAGWELARMCYLLSANFLSAFIWPASTCGVWGVLRLRPSAALARRYCARSRTGLAWTTSIRLRRSCLPSRC